MTNNDRVVCCTRDLNFKELSLGVKLFEMPKLNPHHYVAITVSLLLFALGLYELKEYLGIKVRADSCTELLCSPAHDSSSFAEFFCFWVYATDNRKA
jgi:hypothetical protein